MTWRRCSRGHEREAVRFGRGIGVGRDNPPPIFFLFLTKRKRAVDGPKEKNAAAGRSAQARTSGRRRGMVGRFSFWLHQTRCSWGILWPGDGPDTPCSSFRWRWPGGCWALCRQGNKRAGADWFRLCSFSFIPQTAWRRESPRPPRCGRAYTGMGRGCGRYCWTPADR